MCERPAGTCIYTAVDERLCPRRPAPFPWILTLHVQIIPLENYHSFLVHHLPDKNWRTRSECFFSVDQLGNQVLIRSAFILFCSDPKPSCACPQVRSWLQAFSQGRRDFLCGRWWDDTWCRKNIKVSQKGGVVCMVLRGFISPCMGGAGKLQTVPAKERKIKGSCPQWRNVSDGEK